MLTCPGEVSFPRKRESMYINGLLDARFHGHDEFDLLKESMLKGFFNTLLGKTDQL